MKKKSTIVQNPQIARTTSLSHLKKTSSMSPDPAVKFKRIERMNTQLTLPFIQLSPIKKPQKTLETIISNAEYKNHLRKRELENLDILDQYLSKEIIKPTKVQPPPKEKDQRYEKCYNQQVLTGALESILTQKGILTRMDNVLLNNKIRNSLNSLENGNLIMSYLNGDKQALQIITKIFYGDDIDYELAREVMRADECIKQCIQSFQKRQVHEVNGKIQEERKELISMFKNMSYKMSRKSTDYRQRLALMDTLKKIDVDNLSFMNNDSYVQIGQDIRKNEENLGRFNRINGIVLNHSKMMFEEISSLRGLT